MIFFEDKFDGEVEVVPLLDESVINEMSKADKERYLEKLTTNQYESLTIHGGRSLVARHDNRLKRLSKRTEWVEKTIENNIEEYEYGLDTLLNGGARFETQKVPRALDFMGTYLLKSLDIETTRMVDEYNFYVDEREYNSHGSMSDTVYVDIDENVDLFSDRRNDDSYQQDGFSARLYKMLEMLNLEEMEFEEKKKLLYRGIPEKDNPLSALRDIMQNVYELVMNSISKESDKEIVVMIIAGKTEEEIALHQNCTQQNINKKIKRIVNNMGKH